MDASSAFHIATFSWLSIQGLPLIFTPGILLPLLATQLPTQDGPAIDLELANYLARSVGIASLAFAILSLLLSGLIPLSTLADADPTTVAAYSSPAVTVTTLFHFATTFHCYTSYQALSLNSSGSAYLLGAICSGSLAAMGVWTAMFGGGSHISRKTGQDKRKSGWPFGDRTGKRGITVKQT